MAVLLSLRIILMEILLRRRTLGQVCFSIMPFAVFFESSANVVGDFCPVSQAVCLQPRDEKQLSAEASDCKSMRSVQASHIVLWSEDPLISSPVFRKDRPRVCFLYRAACVNGRPSRKPYEPDSQQPYSHATLCARLVLCLPKSSLGKGPPLRNPELHI